MPKPLKKTAKPSAARAVESDSTVTSLTGEPFEEQFRARMAELGRKGGRVSGSKRMEMPALERREIAMKAAKARWIKRSTQA